MLAPIVIDVERAVVRPVGPGLPTTAAYMVLRNPGDRPDALIGARCACARSVEAHETMAMPMPVMRAGGAAAPVMHMAASGPVTIPAHGAVTFAPEGRHLMLTGMTRPIRAGERVSMVLTFRRAGAVPVDFLAKRP